MAELGSKHTFHHMVGKMYVFEHDFDGSPNPRVDIYPQMGSEHNINLIFVRFSPSRVGLKKISMKNSHANLLFEPRKKKLFFSVIRHAQAG